ncbi:hypothetical protein ACFPRL_23340 [Pseudoclavibacter helvolus]
MGGDGSPRPLLRRELVDGRRLGHPLPHGPRRRRERRRLLARLCGVKRRLLTSEHPPFSVSVSDEPPSSRVNSRLTGWTWGHAMSDVKAKSSSTPSSSRCNRWRLSAMRRPATSHSSRSRTLTASRSC